MRPQLVLVSYDICGEGHERRLRRVYRTLRGYGEHLQYSVFRCALTELRLAELEAALDAEVAHDRDQILIIPLGPADSRASWKMTTIGVPLNAPERVVRIV